MPNLLQLSLPLPVKAPIGDSDPSSSTLQVRSENGVDLDEEIGQSLACDWLEPPPFSGASKEEPRHQLGEEGVILEAFQQFQHDPQIQVRSDRSHSMFSYTYITGTIIYQQLHSTSRFTTILV